MNAKGIIIRDKKYTVSVRGDDRRVVITRLEASDAIMRVRMHNESATAHADLLAAKMPAIIPTAGALLAIPGGGHLKLKAMRDESGVAYLDVSEVA